MLLQYVIPIALKSIVIVAALQENETADINDGNPQLPTNFNLAIDDTKSNDKSNSQTLFDSLDKIGNNTEGSGILSSGSQLNTSNQSDPFLFPMPPLPRFSSNLPPSVLNGTLPIVAAGSTPTNGTNLPVNGTTAPKNGTDVSTDGLTVPTNVTNLPVDNLNGELNTTAPTLTNSTPIDSPEPGPTSVVVVSAQAMPTPTPMMMPPTSNSSTPIMAQSGVGSRTANCAGLVLANVFVGIILQIF